MTLAAKLIQWLGAALLIPLATLVWRPLGGDAPWHAQIDHGELILIAVVLLATGVGQCAAVSANSQLAQLLKTCVVVTSLSILVLEIGVYNVFSPGPHKRPGSTPDLTISYIS